MSRAQLMSSSGVAITFLRAQISRLAQPASICVLSAVLSTPRSRNGPTWSRGSAASSRTTGNPAALLLMTDTLVPHRSLLITHHSSAHRMTQLNLAIDMVSEIADDAAMLLAGDELQALVGDAAELVELAFQVAHHLAHGGPVDLVARQPPHLIDDLVHLVGELVAHAAHHRDDAARHADRPVLNAHVAGIPVEDAAQLTEHAIDVFERADFLQVELVQIELRIVGTNVAQAAQSAAGVLGPLELVVQVIESLERLGVVGPHAMRLLQERQ